MRQVTAYLPKTLVFASASALMSSAMAYAQIESKNQVEDKNQVLTKDIPTLQSPEVGFVNQINPFDFIQQQAENLDITPQKQAFKISKSMTRSVRDPSQAPMKMRTTNQPSTALKYQKRYAATPERSQALYKALVRQYGQPKSVRGQSHVWDIRNPNPDDKQAGVVTVILKLAANGEYELIMDRARGEDGRATWSAPRIPKPTTDVMVKKGYKKKALLQPILQLDND